MMEKFYLNEEIKQFYNINIELKQKRLISSKDNRKNNFRMNLSSLLWAYRIYCLYN